MNKGEFQVKMNQSKYHGQGHAAMIKQAWELAIEGNKEGVNESLCWAASVGHKDLIEFLLTDKEAKTLADIHAKNDYAFLIAYAKNHTDVLSFFINDMNIEKTKLIEEQILKNKNEEIIEMFNKRDNIKKSSVKIK